MSKRETPQEVYVILGRKMPHVYTSLERAYRGLERRFPGEARIVINNTDYGPLTKDTFMEAMVQFTYIQVNSLTHFHKVCRTYIDDILPRGEDYEKETQDSIARVVGRGYTRADSARV